MTEKLHIFTGEHGTITNFRCSWLPDAEWEQVKIPREEFGEPDIVARLPHKRPRWRCAWYWLLRRLAPRATGPRAHKPEHPRAS